MVFVGGGEVEERKDSKTSEKRFTMATAPERSRDPNNISLPYLKWGRQRHLRCVKEHEENYTGGGGGGRRSPPTSSKPYQDSGELSRKPLEAERKRRSLYEPENPRRSSRAAEVTKIRRRHAMDPDGDDGIEAVRKKLMLDLQTEMHKMKFAVLREGSEDITPLPRMEAPVAAEARPWNLRTRRALCKEPNADGGGKIQKVNEGNSDFPPARGTHQTGVAGIGYYDGIERPRAKFSVPLSKQEIEEDFIAITGTRPPRRPKKRLRQVQKQIDTIFPGLWLSEITADMYKVNESLEGVKRS